MTCRPYSRSFPLFNFSPEFLSLLFFEAKSRSKTSDHNIQPAWSTMGKGKGHQSGGFGSKSQKATYAHEFHERVGEVKLSRPRRQSQSTSTLSSQQRPRLTRLSQLRGILQERHSQEAYELEQRRRRDGFLPQRDEDTCPKLAEVVSHPPGWILNYGKEQNPPEVVESLQSKCLKLIGEYIQEYLEAMGKNELHAALSLLPSETLATLSVVVSKTSGVNNDLAIVLGKHAHVEGLCFRAAHDDQTLNDEGLLELVPHLPSQGVHESWEELEDDHDHALVDVLHLEGCNVRLKRLELIDCPYITADAVIKLLEKCACITHLSLAGSLHTVEDGVRVFRELPNLLPGLQVLDITRCSWMTTSFLESFRQCYLSQKPPSVYCQGCFTGSIQGSGQDW
jgi:hypothetical protein